ncbi:dihydrofolate reductase [Flaviflexus equikiangi]|uniref:dihydrofolate reductase n=1 Tax=Flaviflexus equikiangi TaxID=2758573 RepID=A0ABS2TFJ3_9ACTO|nr:dihydrofolate reductase [Flaviflexus equikiangi]MBM9433426.1 dihydrofolate reductase [Flaviflexus equikiangi]
MTLAAIWAQGHDRAIGRGGRMAWSVPEDFAHFKRMTLGHPVIMGRATYDSLGEKYRPLPGRRNIVLTRSSLEFPGCETAASLDDARARVEGQFAWIIGGAQVYEEALPYVDGLIVTDIDVDVPGADAFAPVLPDWFSADAPEWEIVGADPERGWHTSSTGISYRFTALQRRGTTPWVENPLG